MNTVLFDNEQVWKNLLPLTFTRPVSEIRIGILTIREKWERGLGAGISYKTEAYLQRKFPAAKRRAGIHIDSSYCPDSKLIKAVKSLKTGELLVSDKGEVIAYHGDPAADASTFKKQNYTGNVIRIRNLWDIFVHNGAALQADFDMITKNRLSLPISRSVTVIGKRANVFMEVGAKVEACILNTTGGPIYIDKGAEIMEGSAVRGPFALGKQSQLKMNSKVYGPATVGPYCKAGGEIGNSVIFGYSNKAHDGFLGNSVVAEWCNLGADTNNSNLKNNYGNVKVHSYAKGSAQDSGLQFCGLFMGDHSKSGINTMFNTGTVVGVGCNIFGGGFPPTFIPDFSWGGKDGFETHKLDKLFETAAKVYERRKLEFSEAEQLILKEVFERTRH
jgi:UDP-N-acetylglucosamine diphosphorylase/glucosamine-1-phosphate N-acetyltransferase